MKSEGIEFSRLINQSENQNIKHLKCEICNNIPWEPTACKNCGEMFCESCIEEYIKKTDKNCPKCNFEFSKEEPHKSIKKILNDLILKCKNSECEESVLYKDLKSHEENCEFSLIYCEKCKEEIKSKDFLNHFANCKKKQICSCCDNCQKSKKIEKKDVNLFEDFKIQIEFLVNEKVNKIIYENIEMIKSNYEEKYDELKGCFDFIRSEMNRLEEDLKILKLKRYIEKKKEVKKIDHDLEKLKNINNSSLEENNYNSKSLPAKERNNGSRFIKNKQNTFEEENSFQEINNINESQKTLKRNNYKKQITNKDSISPADSYDLQNISNDFPNHTGKLNQINFKNDNKTSNEQSKKFINICSPKLKKIFTKIDNFTEINDVKEQTSNNSSILKFNENSEIRSINKSDFNLNDVVKKNQKKSDDQKMIKNMTNTSLNTAYPNSILKNDSWENSKSIRKDDLTYQFDKKRKTRDYYFHHTVDGEEDHLENANDKNINFTDGNRKDNLKIDLQNSNKKDKISTDTNMLNIFSDSNTQSPTNPTILTKIDFENTTIKKCIQCDDIVKCIIVLKDTKYSSNGLIVSGHNKGHICIWNLDNQKIVKIYKEHTNTVWDIRNFQKHKFLSASSDFTIKLWDIESKNSLSTLKLDCTCFRIEPLFNFNPNFISISGYDRKIIIYDISKNQKITSFISDPDNVAQRILFLDKIKPFNLILTANYKDVKLWNLETSKQVTSFIGHLNWIYGIEYIKDEIFATASNDKSIRIWSISQSKCIKVINAHKNNINCFVTLYDYINEHFIITGSSDNTMKIIDLNKGFEMSTLIRDEEIYYMIVVENGKKINIITIANGNSKNIKIWTNLE